MSGVDERVETVRRAMRPGCTAVKVGATTAPCGICHRCRGAAALYSLAAAVAGLEQRADELEAALVEVGGGWRDTETPPCYCDGDSTTEKLARCTRIRNLLTSPVAWEAA